MLHKDKFLELYEPIHPRLCKYIQSFVWDREQAKDLISEVTLQAFERFSDIKSQEAFVFYVFSIARNLFIKSIRQNKFKQSINQDQLLAFEGYQHSEETIKKYELFNLLNKLDPLNREVLVLFEISGFSYKEISQLKELSEAQVKALLYQTRQQLKEIVASENEKLKFHSTNQQSHE